MDGAQVAARARRAARLARSTRRREPLIPIVRFLDGPTQLMQRGSFIGQILSDAGLARPASQDVDDFALEIGEEQIR